MTNTIAIDGMGGDHGPVVIVPGAFHALAAHPDLNIILVGDEPSLQREIAKLPTKLRVLNDRVTLIHSTQVVTMDEPPAQALRSKKDSSMRVAINAVKSGDAVACVSAGNTGALVVTARYVLRPFPGIDRPAIISEIPTMKNKVRVLDLGANVDVSAHMLYQFAMMGSELVKALQENERPKVGLLNIGVEAIKGNEVVKQTAKLLSSNRDHLNYVGYVEGDDIYRGEVDVIVCDGFVGNVALKTSEGLAKMLGAYIKDAFNKNILTRLAGLIVLPVLKGLKKRIDPARYNGATLLGLKGIVIKSHGGAGVKAFACAIDEALSQASHDVPKLIGQRLQNYLETGY